MDATYDSDSDRVYLHFTTRRRRKVLRQVILSDDVIVDVDDSDGEPVGLEILNVSSIMPAKFVDWLNNNSSKP